MFIQDLILPILIGIVASFALISILYNNKKVKQAFTDIAALMQLQASTIPNTPIWMPLDSTCKMDTNMNMNMNTNILQKITNINSPLYTDDSKDKSIYNYYPQTPIV